MAIAVFATHVGFINLNNAHQLAELGVSQGRADAVRHVERGFVGAEPHGPLDFEGGDALLAGQHHVNDLKPLAHADVAVLENRADQHGEAVARLVGRASVALPVKRACRQRVGAGIAATGAANAFWPAAGGQILLTSLIRWEKGFKLGDRHLPRELCHRRVSLA